MADPSSRRERLTFVLWCALGGLVAAVPAGWVWAAVAGPPSGALTEQGVFFGEEQLDQVSGVTLWFLVVTTAFGLVAGLVVGWLGQRHGLVTVVGVLVLCGLAAWFTYWWGVHVFGPDEKAQLAEAKVGDQITSELELGTKIVYLGWPIGGLTGTVAAIFGWPKDENRQEAAPESSNVFPS